MLPALLLVPLAAAAVRPSTALTRRAALTRIAVAVPFVAVPTSARGAVAGGITGSDKLGRSCQTQSTPALTVVTCRGFGLQRDGRLAGCAADEACLSSSAVNNPSKFSPPWAPSSVSPEAADAARAWRSLVAAVQDQPGLEVVERDDTGRYLRATAPTVVSGLDAVDDIEFLLRTDSGAAPRALFRSSTRQSVFVYPLQQPVPNQKSHFDRLEAIRLRLGWENQGLSGDSALEAEMSGAKVGNFFGFLSGVKVPDDEDY